MELRLSLLYGVALSAHTADTASAKKTPLGYGKSFAAVSAILRPW